MSATSPSLANAPTVLMDLDIPDSTLPTLSASAQDTNPAEGNAGYGWSDGICKYCGTAVRRDAFRRHRNDHCPTRRQKRQFQCRGCLKTYGRLDALKRHWGRKNCPGKHIGYTLTFPTPSPSSGPGGGPHTMPQTSQAPNLLEPSRSPIAPAPVAVPSTSTDHASHGFQPRLLPTLCNLYYADPSLFANRDPQVVGRCDQCELAEQFRYLSLLLNSIHAAPATHQGNCLYSQPINSASQTLFENIPPLRYGYHPDPAALASQFRGEQLRLSNSFASGALSDGGQLLFDIDPTHGAALTSTNNHAWGRVQHKYPVYQPMADYTNGEAATLPDLSDLPHAPQLASGLWESLMYDPDLELDHGIPLEEHVSVNADLTTTDSCATLHPSSEDPPPEGIARPPFGL